MTEQDITPEDDDVEGHKREPGVADIDDVEGHKRELVGAVDDEDVEGHVRQP